MAQPPFADYNGRQLLLLVCSVVNVLETTLWSRYFVWKLEINLHFNFYTEGSESWGESVKYVKCTHAQTDFIWQTKMCTVDIESTASASFFSSLLSFLLIIIHIARNRVQNTAIIYPKQVQSIYSMLQTYCEDIEKERSVIACHTLILSHIQ